MNTRHWSKEERSFWNNIHSFITEHRVNAALSVRDTKDPFEIYSKRRSPYLYIDGVKLKRDDK